MKKTVIAIMVIVVISIAPAIYAADLYGYIADKSGKPIEIKVELKDSKQKQASEPVTSDKKGYYAFKDIKPGEYQVVVGEKSIWKIFVGPGETRRDFRLE